MKVGDLVELSAYALALHTDLHRHWWGKVGIIVDEDIALLAFGAVRVAYKVHWVGDAGRTWMAFDRRELKFVSKRK